MTLRRLLPGLSVLCLGAVLARAVGIATGVNHLLAAIALGFVLANGIGVSDRFGPGLATHKLWLGAGIVLMGASLTLDTILEVGGIVLLVVVLVTATTLMTVELLSRNIFGLDDRLGSLLAAGASICGVSAVIAVAGAIRARENQIVYAAATVLLFDAITIVVYPIVGEILDLSDVVFGIWAGVSMFSTGPVVAVGFDYSETAGQWATMTKLSRNALIGVIVIVYASYYAGGDERASIGTLWDEFPKFVLGFLALMLLASTGVLTSTQHQTIERAYDWLFLLAFVGLGTEIRLADLRNTGPTPLVLILTTLTLVSLGSLALILFLL
jgi:uncharacterized integral membrane protein (TIGR00698 family)